jgi:thiamine biosynthesis lipoprotein
LRLPSRRRFLQIVAATSVSGLAAFRAHAARAGAVQRWEGEALGADASISLAGLEPRTAEELLRACRDEIVRLEGIFSLFSETSTLSHLNAHGSLADPPLELIDLLDTCRRIFELSNGGFDPTIQPLWRLYAETYGDPRNPRAPDAGEIASRLGNIGFGSVSWNRRRVAFARPGMAMTLNGIAQGAITDRITTLLRNGGATHALVNVGEYSGLGNHPEGRPWQVGIQDPRKADGIVELVDLVDQCVATSGAYGGRFGDSGLSHIIDPRTARSPERYLSVSVRHASATLADGLSTAFSFLSESEIAAVAGVVGGTTAILVRSDGSLARI